MTLEEQKRVALAILNAGGKLTRKSGSFLGQCFAAPEELTDRQDEWFRQLAERAGVEIVEADHG